MLKTQEILRSQLRVYLRFVVATRDFKSQRIESQASTNEPLYKLKEILARANVEEFNNLKKAYEETSKLTAIPDWITVKLASIAMSRQQNGEKILVGHWQMTGSDKRIDHQSDVTKEQIAAALARVWQAGCTQFDDQRSFHAVLNFYNQLRRLKFTPIRDTHVAQLIQYAIKSGYTTNALLELYRDLSQSAEKPMAKTTFFILNSAKSEKEIQEIKEVVAKKISSSTLSLLDKFVALDRGKGPSLADELNRLNDPLKSDQLQQLVFWASKWKRNNVLEELFEYAQLFGFDSFSKVLVYNALVLSYGKSSNTEGLRRIAKRIVKEDDRREFSVALSRIRHFYKCMNKQPPEETINSKFAHSEKNK
ncbi:unnamed protein product, partial [Mesorhabditis belari]|uniref:Uncharacterized protein n=1 Tax=Mesorhabditis belari TaxID=2138241 RepID=A0AAF3J404_9BILA